MRYSCLIVDDEPYAIEIIENYVSQIGDLDLVGKCYNAVQTMQMLHDQKVDIIFLDIEMPLINGLELIKTLDYKPQIILITAFRDYAIDGFDLDVADYLLKPVSFTRFHKAVNKAISALTSARSNEKESEKDHIFFKVDKKLVSIKLEDILYIESLKDYVRVKTLNGNYIVYQTLNGVQAKLPASNFFRVQKSYIIAINKVKSVEGNTLEIASEKIPISRHCKEEVLKLILSKGISAFR